MSIVEVYLHTSVTYIGGGGAEEGWDWRASTGNLQPVNSQNT